MLQNPDFDASLFFYFRKIQSSPQNSKMCGKCCNAGLQHHRCLPCWESVVRPPMQCMASFRQVACPLYCAYHAWKLLSRVHLKRKLEKFHNVDVHVLKLVVCSESVATCVYFSYKSSTSTQKSECCLYFFCRMKDLFKFTPQWSLPMIVRVLEKLFQLKWINCLSQLRHLFLTFSKHQIDVV